MLAFYCSSAGVGLALLSGTGNYGMVGALWDARLTMAPSSYLVPRMGPRQRTSDPEAGYPVNGTEADCARLLLGRCVSNALLALLGKAPIAQLAAVTGISETTLRKKNLRELHGAHRKRAEENMLRALQSRLHEDGVIGPVEPSEIVRKVSDALHRVHGPASLMAVFLAPEAASDQRKALVVRLDAFELELEEALVAKELDRVWMLLGDATRLPPEYRGSLAGTSLPSWPVDRIRADDADLRARLTIHRANATLSLLAMIDHDMIQWLSSRPNIANWDGRSWLAPLLVDADRSAARQRHRPCAPVARFVDYVYALGAYAHDRRWPAAPPTVATIDAQARRNGFGGNKDGQELVFAKKLRSGEQRLTQSNLKRFAYSQLGTPHNSKWVNVDGLIDVYLIPMALTVHLLSGVIPTLPGSTRHLDTTGWRDAYLRWWGHHGNARGLRLVPQAPGIPAWIRGDQSSA